MDQRDEFSKWMSAVEEALTSEAKPVVENVPAMNECACGEWDCPVCFPHQDEMPGMHGQMDGMGGHNPEATVIGPAMMGGMDNFCPTCGHSHEDGGMEHEMEVEMPLEDGSAGGMGAGGMASAPQPMEEEMNFDQAWEFYLNNYDKQYTSDDEALELFKEELGRQGCSPELINDIAAYITHRHSDDNLEEEPMHFDQEPKTLPRGDNGGVKLGQIVQKFVPADQDGEDSPLTYGEKNLGALGEEEFDSMGSDNETGINPHSPEQSSDMEFASQTDGDIDSAQDMMNSIMSMQQKGLSKSKQVYDQMDFQNMGPSDLKKAYDVVMGTVAEEMPMAQPQPAPAGVAPPTPGVTPPSAGATPSMAGGGSPASPGGNYAPGTAPTMPESRGRIMENVDKDVAAMLNSLKKYDMLKESVAPVLGMVTLGEKKGGKPEWLENAEKKAEKKAGPADKDETDGEGSDLDEDTEQGRNPWEKLATDKKDDEKTSTTHKGGTVKKTETGLTHKSGVKEDSHLEGGKKSKWGDDPKNHFKSAAEKIKDKLTGDKKEEVKEEADPEILEWMNRFSKLGNMKGYGR